MNHTHTPDILLHSHPMLPRPQGSALAILEASKAGELTQANLLKRIEEDALLTSKLRKFFQLGVNGAIKTLSLEHSLASMGTVAIKNLALFFSLTDQYSDGLCIDFDYPKFWSESLVMGFFMTELAISVGMRNPGELGSWAMLSRVGCLGLATSHPIQYAKLLRSQQGDATLLESEQAAFNTDRLSLGTSLLSSWGLPNKWVDAILRQESCDAITGTMERESFFRYALQFSFQAARLACHPGEPTIRFEETKEAFRTAHRITTDRLQQCMQRAVYQSRACAELLGMPDCAVAEVRHRSDSVSKATEPVGGQLKILIIEDDPILKRLLQTWLKIEVGHSIISASNGEEALVLAEHHLPQVIITDWRMPVMDGISFCRALRKTAWGEGMYVLMLTSASDEDDLVQAFEAGVDDFQSKPLNRQALGARLRAAWRYVHLRSTWVKDNQRLELANADMELTIRRLQLSSMKDASTDLANRRAGQVAISQAISIGQRHGMQLCVIALDIDFFKLLNESAGRDAANEVLQLIAVTIQQAARVEDTVCRWGPEEFMVIAPGLRLQDGIAAAKRFRSLIANHHMALESASVGVTVSVGVACWDSEAKANEQLLAEVDKALMQAKHSGGNRVAIFEQGSVRIL